MARKFGLVGFCLLLVFSLPVLGFSEEKYPSKPINLYIGFSPGGSTDLTARAIADQMSIILGQPIVSINKPGGGATVEAALLSQTKPDGYTIGTLNTSAISIVPHLRDMPYNPISGFSYIGEVGLNCIGLCVRPDSPWKTLKEFIDYAKKNPGKVSYSTTGAGQHQHIAMEYLAKREGIEWKHIPYAGGADANTALLGGHVTATSGGTTHISAVKQGLFRMLVVYEGRRMAEFPDVPTLKDCGYDLALEQALGFAGPKGIPEPILDKLEAAMKKALFTPEVAKVMKTLEMPVMYRDRKTYQKYLEDEYWLMEKLLKELGMYKKG